MTPLRAADALSGGQARRPDACERRRWRRCWRMLMKTPAIGVKALPGFVRAAGGVRVAIGRTARGSAPLTIAESGGYRVRFPRAAGACEGVLINTGGGMAGGDRMSIAVSIAEGARAVLTTQAAEKLYRSRRSGHRDRGRHRARARKPARLAAPGADPFRRRAPAAPARCRARRLGCPDARRERGVRPGRDGRGRRKRELPRPLADTPRRPAGFCRGRQVGRPAANPRAKSGRRGGRALATVLHLAGDAEARRDAARAALEDARCECGVGAWNGMLVARFLSPDPQALRADLARFLEFFRGTPMPRSWQT